MAYPFEPGRKYTVEEYIRLDDLSDVRHEFCDGLVYEVGSPPPPTPIVSALEVFTKLTARVQLLLSTQGILVHVAYSASERGAVLFAKRTPDGDFPVVAEQIKDPSSIIVLTSDFSYVPMYHEFFDSFRAIESVREIAWIFADGSRADIYKRSGDETWLIDFVRSPEQEIKLASIGVRFPLAEALNSFVFPTDPA